jgi:hypothetical protein
MPYRTDWVAFMKNLLRKYWHTDKKCWSLSNSHLIWESLKNKFGDTRLRTCWLVKCFALPRIILLDSVEFGKVKSKQQNPHNISKKRQNTEGVFLLLKKQYGTNSSETSNIIDIGFEKPRQHICLGFGE